MIFISKLISYCLDFNVNDYIITYTTIYDVNMVKMHTVIFNLATANFVNYSLVLKYIILRKYRPSCFAIESIKKKYLYLILNIPILEESSLIIFKIINIKQIV